MKIVNKKKFIRSMIILFVIVFIIPLIFAKVTFSYKQVEYISIYVHYGILQKLSKELMNIIKIKMSDI